MRVTSTLTVPTVVVLGLVASSARASVIHTASDLSSVGVSVSLEARLTISDDFLTVELLNNSPVDSLNPNDLLASYYFDILDAEGNRPVLSYLSAVGDVYTGDRDLPDPLVEARADLMALAVGDNTWQFKEMDATAYPFLGFGLGTVGNGNLWPINNFNGNIVHGIDYAIYRGDITTRNLHLKPLVKDSATFTFSGLTGFAEADISDSFAFGLGTAPDSLLIPEPASALLLLASSFPLLRRKRSR